MAKLPIKRSLLGYRTRDVELLLADRDAELDTRAVALRLRDARIEQLDEVTRCLSEIVVDRERELGTARRELGEEQAARRAAQRALEAIDAAARRLVAEDEVERPAEREGEPVLSGDVRLDIGPLSDFAQLIRVEDAARAIGAATGISIKRFSGGRATLAMSLSEPVDLLRELEERSDLELRVRRAGEGEIVLDIGDEGSGA